MPILSTISLEETRDFSILKSAPGSRMHLLLPAIFFALVLIVIFGFEYYKDWKRKRRLNRYWQDKSGRR